MVKNQSMNFSMPFPICFADAISSQINCVLLLRESINMDSLRLFFGFLNWDVWIRQPKKYTIPV